MNRIIAFGTITMIIALLLTSCSKDDEVGGEVGTKYMKVKIDGREKVFPNVQARWIDAGTSLEIMGSDNGREWLTIAVLSETTRVPAGQYSLDDASSFTILATHGQMVNDTQLNHAATKNTITAEDGFDLRINKIDNGAVEGIFSGVLARVEGLNTLSTVTLTEGTFKMDIKPN